MNLFAILDLGFLEWLFRASWQVAVLAMLIVVAQALLGKRLRSACR